MSGKVVSKESREMEDRVLDMQTFRILIIMFCHRDRP
jgi:hypothetical protein